MSEWKDTTVANAIATSMTPRPTVEEWAQRIGYDVVGTTIGRAALAELLDVLKDAPFSCGHDEAGDPACDTDRIDIDVCCGLSGLRNAMGHVVALLGLMVGRDGGWPLPGSGGCGAGEDQGHAPGASQVGGPHRRGVGAAVRRSLLSRPRSGGGTPSRPPLGWDRLAP